MPTKQSVQSSFNAKDPRALERFSIEVARVAGQPIAVPTLTAAVDGTNQYTFTLEIRNQQGVKLTGVWEVRLYASAGANITLPTSSHITYTVSTGQKVGEVGEVLHAITDEDGDLVVVVADSASVAARRLYASVEGEFVLLGTHDYSS